MFQGSHNKLRRSSNLIIVTLTFISIKKTVLSDFLANSYVSFFFIIKNRMLKSKH